MPAKQHQLLSQDRNTCGHEESAMLLDWPVFRTAKYPVHVYNRTTRRFWENRSDDVG